MRVGSVMMPFPALKCISIDDSLERAIEIIDENQLLSLPVVDGQEFIGVLSKQYVYEDFFRNQDCGREEFMRKKVREFMKSTIETISVDIRLEEAAARFIRSKARFIPVTNEFNQLLGIVTQQAVFRQYQKMFGQGRNSLVVYNFDDRGTMARLAEAVAKAGGNISNLIVMPTDVMDLVEVFMRIEANDFEKVVKALKKQGFDVRDVKYEKIE